MLAATLLTSSLLFAAPDAGAPSPTRGVMRGLFEAVLALEPVLAQPARMHDPAEAKAIAGHLQTLATAEHAFPAEAKAQEPATAALGALFSRYAKETHQRFLRGEREQVAHRVRTLTSLCFTCHSRERVARDFEGAAGRVEKLTLTPLERAQYLAVTRQFDAALAAYAVVLQGPWSGERAVLDASRALREALAIQVRVKDDPKQAAALLEAVLARKDLPPFLQATVGAWAQDIAAWKKERFDAARASPEALFKKAQGLVQRASATAGFFADERSDVQYLRASGYLNLALGKAPRAAFRGEALYLLGACASALHSSALWDVDLLFFETCVRENPHTPLARRCFKQLSDRLYFGFTGSAGTQVPDDELERMGALRALADR